MAEHPSSRSSYSPPDYRTELFCPDDDGPYWVSVEDPNGAERDAAEAAKLVASYVGPLEMGLTVTEVAGRIEEEGGDVHARELHFYKDAAGPLRFWEVDC